MIQITKNDTLIDVIEKIQAFEGDEIVLKFPIGHSILHNYLSLKIIKSKSSPKKITIITPDVVSRKIGKKLGIHYSILKEGYVGNSEYDENIMKHNFSFKEYLKFELKKYYREIMSLIKRNKQINDIKKYSKKYKSYSNIGFFISMLVISISLFVFIFYFAINKTTIIITPEISIKKKAKNFVFTENSFFEVIGNDKNIIISSLEEKAQVTKIYTTTGIDPKSIQKSTGKIRLSNLSDQEIQLLPNTRVVTKDGILFETVSWVSIPGATTDNFGESVPGEKDIGVISREYDAEGKFIGERGNVEKDTLFTLPGLQDDGKIVFGTSLEDFSGGNNEYTLQVSEQDINNASLIFEQKLKSEVINALKQKVDQLNKADKTSFEILTVDDIIEYSNIDITIKNNVKVGDLGKNIILEGSIIGKTYIYDKEALINKLKTVVQENILQGVESVLFIDENSLRVSSVIYRKDEPLEVKATVEIDTLISHDFQDTDNAYTKKLRSTIRGMDKKEAVKLLLNDPKISNAEIIIRPFFLGKISNISENIVFEIKKD